MRIVDKYGLVKCSIGTPFYNLKSCDGGVNYGIYNS